MKAVVTTTAEFSLVYGPPEVVERYTLYPATAEGLAFHDRSTKCGTGAIPVPLSVIVVGELVALLAKEVDPVTAPAD